MAKKEKYGKPELAALLHKELRQALGAPDSEIALKRLRNLQFYRAEAEGELSPPAVPDRSSIVATDVADTVEWMLPSLVRVFATSKDSMQCKPKHPRYAGAAKLAQSYLTHKFWEQNAGFMTLYTWGKDALVQKVGTVKVYWDKSPESSEEPYRGLTATQVEDLMGEEGVEVLEQASRMVEVEAPEGEPMPVEVFDLRIRRTLRKGRCKVEPVPPEEMRIHRRARYGQDVPFVAQERYETRADLEAEGYDLDGVSSGGEHWNMEMIERHSSQSPFWTDESDGELQRYLVSECYIKLDQDDDGVPEWRRVLMIGGTVMEDEKVDGHPYVFFCPVPDPHVFFGQCPADFAIQPQRLGTSLIRGLMDNIYLSVNKRTAIVDGQVNLDDLLNNRPGGVVRMKTLDAVRPMDQGGLDPGAWQMIEWGEQWRERRTGFTRYSQGMSPDALNPTATGVSLITEKADQRTELIARVWAQSVREMYRLMLKCMGRYQDIPELVELMDGQWFEVDPREWCEGFDIDVDVGLGTGSKDKKAVALQTVHGMQAPMVQAGMLPPQAAVASARDFCDAVGLGDGVDYFPDPPPPNPQNKPPQVMVKEMELQADAQKFQAESQQEAARMRMEVELENSKARAQAEVDINRQRAEGEQQAQKAQLQAQLQAQEAERTERLEMARIAAQERQQVRQLKAQIYLALAQRGDVNALQLAQGLDAGLEAAIDGAMPTAPVMAQPEGMQ
jgi:hypothetical protein